MSADQALWIAVYTVGGIILAVAAGSALALFIGHRQRWEIDRMMDDLDGVMTPAERERRFGDIDADDLAGGGDGER